MLHSEDGCNSLGSIVSNNRQQSTVIPCKIGNKQGAQMIHTTVYLEAQVDASKVRENQAEHWVLEAIWILERLKQLEFIGPNNRRVHNKDRASQICICNPLPLQQLTIKLKLLETSKDTQKSCKLNNSKRSHNFQRYSSVNVQE